ncbi:MAG: hypothetical protein E7006_00935 [Alphaproteobacteria bacterium]|nr:hypothetical protein [Alphaproteobacteria bacterium]
MGKMLIVLTLCVLTGCVSLSKTEVEQMEINKDPIEAVNLFHRYNSTLEGDMEDNCVSAILSSIGTLGLALPAVPYYCFSYDVEKLSVPGTRFDCVNGSDSDECIVYRRTMKESKINYFDYKRFLPEDTAIKTETDFLAMVNYYELRYLCDKLAEKTTEEKQQCKDLIENNTRMMATKKPKCKDLYVTDVSKDYEELLQRVASGYNWMIDHDPYGYVDVLIESGYTNKSILQSAYQPVLSKREALEESLQRLRVFADEKFCDIGDWKSDLRKVGAYL